MLVAMPDGKSNKKKMDWFINYSKIDMKKLVVGGRE